MASIERTVYRIQLKPMAGDAFLVSGQQVRVIEVSDGRVTHTLPGKDDTATQTVNDWGWWLHFYISYPGGYYGPFGAGLMLVPEANRVLPAQDDGQPFGNPE